MLEKLLQGYLKWSGQGHLIPFVEGLTHLGRPSGVLFPKELLEQGAAIVLSGLNNTMAVQSNPDWIWPHWVERQADPSGEEFIPTAINLIKTNVTCRNWTSIGLEDSPDEAMIDPVGMLTLEPYGWSVFPYVRLDAAQNAGDHFPPRLRPRRQVKQSLMEGTRPCVVTRYDVHPALDWRCEAMAVRLDGEPLVSYSHVIGNGGSGHLTLRFGLALRPYNPLTIGHINSIHYRDRLWKVNGRPGLLLLEEPDRLVVSDRHHGDPLLRDVLIAGRTRLKSRSGIACGLAEYLIELPAGETRRIETLGFLGRRHSPLAGSRLREASIPAVAAARDSRRGELRRAETTGLRLRLPDARLQEAFDAVRGHLHVFDDGTHFSPGTFLYHNHWFRDSAYIALAFENAGMGDRVLPKILAYPGLQMADGFFRSQKGEWDSNGEALWTMVNHVRLGADPALLDKLFPSMLKGVKWIERMLQAGRGSATPHYGLLPAGFSAEHFGPNDHYYWDNLWSLAGLEAARWAASRLGRVQDAERITDLLLEYRADVSASMDWTWKKNGQKVLPCSPYRFPDSAAIGNLVGISPLNLVDAREAWVGGTVDFLARNNLRDGLFFQKIVHTGLNPYLSVQLARVMLARGDSRWTSILEALLRRASPTWVWPEAMHPRVHGGCMGDGDHGWSAAEFLNLVRDMMAVERSSGLRLAEGAPPYWFKPGLNLEVTEAPTLHGTVDFSFRQEARSAVLQWTLRRKPHQDPAPLWFRLPAEAGLVPDLGGSGAAPLEENGALAIPLAGDAGTMTFHAPPVREAEPAAIQRIEHA
jgi:hypothetical protein